MEGGGGGLRGKQRFGKCQRAAQAGRFVCVCFSVCVHVHVYGTFSLSLYSIIIKLVPLFFLFFFFLPMDVLIFEMKVFTVAPAH